MSKHELEGGASHPPRVARLCGAVVDALLPERALAGSPYAEAWREQEDRLVVDAGRAALLASAAGLVALHVLVDRPEGRQPAALWALFRLGGAAVFLALLALSFARPLRRGRWASLPLVLGTLIVSTTEARALAGAAGASCSYAVALATVGTLLLRQSALRSLGFLGACLALQWAAAWRPAGTPVGDLVSATLVGALVVALFRGRMGAEVRAFVAEKRELDVRRAQAEAAVADRNAHLARASLDLALSKRKVLVETLEAFALAVEAKDPYTHGHSRRVSLLAEGVCRELGLDEAACETVRIAGLLHDVGKIGVPELVLTKPGRLSAAELEIFKRHSQLGSRIVSAVTELEEVGRAILHHHERFDGAGYPEGLSGERIPLLSRILAVCDAYDAMTSDRPYRAGIAHRAALDEVARCMGLQFDPVVAQTFLRLHLHAPPRFPDFSSGLREARAGRGAEAGPQQDERTGAQIIDLRSASTLR